MWLGSCTPGTPCPLRLAPGVTAPHAPSSQPAHCPFEAGQDQGGAENLPAQQAKGQRLECILAQRLSQSRPIQGTLQPKAIKLSQPICLTPLPAGF